MKRLSPLFLFALVLGTAALAAADEPARLKRKDAFFGIHLDFHCGLNEHVGANTTDEMVNAVLDAVNPDFIQIDCKGHPGISSYPTKVGNPCPDITGDPLRVWRRVTAERGVSLYMHYSGVWDSRAVALHPEWACVNADGSRNASMTSPFGGYVDELMIPQLKELALDYGVDGVWVDGECWAAAPDYGEAAVEAFKKETGLETVPKSKDEPNWSVWMNFHRDAFRHRLRHWVDILHEAAPDFEIASNWAFTDHMPEPVSSGVNFISGDFTPSNSVNDVRQTARFIASQNQPWDLMAWSFAHKADDPKGPWHPKGTPQLMREAACVLSQGGGFQNYYPQNRDGSVDIERVSQMGEIGRFCRARQPFCFRSEPVPQVFLIIPTFSHYDRIDRQGGGLFPNALLWHRGLNNAILDNQYSLDVGTDAAFQSLADRYPAAALCQWEALPPGFAGFLADYVKNGGRLLLTGEKLPPLFDGELKDAVWQNCGPGGALRSCAFGKGLVVVYPQDFSEQYYRDPDAETRDLIGEAMRLVLPEPAVTAEGSHEVDVSLRRTADGKLTVHLVNVSGPHRTDPFFNDIQPVGPLTVRVKTDRAPGSVRLEPDARPLPFERGEDGFVTVAIDRIGIYDILVID